ncbi:hypothetical protein TNCV_4419221 [Trichonephila clavipes]|nr:hypothetical protein TNCV_4419221 [Trichonephila clavipes]
MDSSSPLRTISQQILSVTHRSMSARSIRRGFQQNGMSTRRPLLRLPLTGNLTCLRRQWCDQRKTCTSE